MSEISCVGNLGTMFYSAEFSCAAVEGELPGATAVLAEEEEDCLGDTPRFQVLGFTEFNCSSCVTTNPSLLAFASQKNPLASTMPVLSDSPAPKEDVPRKP